MHHRMGTGDFDVKYPESAPLSVHISLQVQALSNSRGPRHVVVMPEWFSKQEKRALMWFAVMAIVYFGLMAKGCRA